MASKLNSPSFHVLGFPFTVLVGKAKRVVLGASREKNMPNWTYFLSNFGCFRTASAVTTSHEADVEEDDLRLQEDLERLEVEVWKACPYRNKSWGAQCFLIHREKGQKSVLGVRRRGI